jgi:hypothetical protein
VTGLWDPVDPVDEELPDGWARLPESISAAGLHEWADRRGYDPEILAELGAFIVSIRGRRAVFGPGWDVARHWDGRDPRVQAPPGRARRPQLLAAENSGPVHRQPVVIVEGLTDGLAVLHAEPVGDRVRPVPIVHPSAGFDPMPTREIVALIDPPVVVVAVDADRAGDECRARLADALDGIPRLAGRIRHLRPPDGLDLDEWRRKDPTEFRVTLAVALDPVDVEEIPGTLWCQPIYDPGPEPEPEDRNRWRARLLSVSAVIALRPPEPLIAQVLDLDTLSMLYGPPKSMKSFVALDWSCHVAAGIRWHGRETRQGRVLYCAGEGVAGLGIRLQAWQAAHEGAALDDLQVLPATPGLGDDLQVLELVELVEDLRPVLVVIDTLSRATAGLDENSAKDASRVVAQLDRLRTVAGSAVVPVHHSGKDTSAGLRGSSVLLAAADAVVRVERDRGRVDLKWEASKNHEDPAPITLQARAVGLSLVLGPGEQYDPVEALPIAHRIALEALETVTAGVGPCTFRQWLTVWNVSESHAYRLLKDLTGPLELVERLGAKSSARFQLSPTALSLLDAGRNSP